MISDRSSPSARIKASFTSTNLASGSFAMVMSTGHARNAVLNRAWLSRKRSSLSRNPASACLRSEMSLMTAWMTLRPPHSTRVRMTSNGTCSPRAFSPTHSKRALPFSMHSAIWR